MTIILHCQSNLSALNALINVRIQNNYASCLELCEFYESFRCETFSYCYDSGKCSLSSQIFVRPMTSDEIIYDGDCNIISSKNLLALGQ